MQRDMELIRKIALTIEASSTGYAPDRLEIDGEYTSEQIGYHAHLMMQAGLATGTDITTLGGSSPAAMLQSLTWTGHEFVEAARDDTRWKKAMGVVKDKGGSVTLSVLVQLLTEMMRKSLGLP